MNRQPKSSLRQQQVQLGQRVYRRLRGAQFHVSTSHCIEHPGGNHYHDAWSRLKVDYLAIGTLLAVLALDPASIQRMPAIKDFNFLPDTGTMTR